jgi:hypothetical protein
MQQNPRKKADVRQKPPDGSFASASAGSSADASPIHQQMLQ